LIQVIWEFFVRQDKIAEFEKVYSVTGSWAALFRGSSGFLGTTLLRDTQTPGRYLTLDRWDGAASRQAMRERFTKEYEAMDRDCKAFTETELQVGVFEEY
jgi:heme-degrading monooxygenase HmoA